MSRAHLPAILLLVAGALLTVGCHNERAQHAGDKPAAATQSTEGVPAGSASARTTPARTASSSDASGSQAAQPAPTAPDSDADAAHPPSSKAKVVEPFPGIRVHVNGKRVELDGRACLEAGWLEFIACSPQTKEHESLVVLPQRPSNIHAALLLAGFEAGRTGSWTYENEQFEFVPPEGSELRIDARYTNAQGERVTVSICTWIRDHLGQEQFPCKPWVFGGSRFADNPEFMGEGEHYVADMTGSIIGLATFGDEVIGYSTVISHESSVHAPEWEVNTRAVPEPGTPVTLIIEAHE